MIQDPFKFMDHIKVHLKDFGGSYWPANNLKGSEMMLFNCNNEEKALIKEELNIKTMKSNKNLHKIYRI